MMPQWRVGGLNLELRKDWAQYANDRQGALGGGNHIHRQSTQLNESTACFIWDTAEWGESVERKVNREIAKGQ